MKFSEGSGVVRRVAGQGSWGSDATSPPRSGDDPL